MASLTLRNVKGSPLTNQEADDNLSALNTELGTKQATLVSGTNIKTINNTSILGSGDITISGGGSSLIPTSIKTSAYTASANDLVRCDTTAGAFSVTLPASPADGATIAFLDMASTFATNYLTVLPNTGKTIESDATSYILDINGTAVSFVYNLASTNWRLLQTPSVPLASGSSIVNTGASTNVTGILLGNGTTLSGVAPGTSGNVLTSNGSTWVSQVAPVSLPSQTGNNGKYLTTDGSTASWATVSGGGSASTGLETNFLLMGA